MMKATVDETIAADYLIGYIDCDMDTPPQYLHVIFTSQEGLPNPVLPKELNSVLANYTSAKHSYENYLKKTLQDTKKTPDSNAFQENTRELVKLSGDLFVRTDEIQGGDGLENFKDNIEHVTQYLKAAFPNSEETE